MQPPFTKLTHHGSGNNTGAFSGFHPESLLNCLPSGFLLVSLPGYSIDFVNDTFLNMTGLSRETIASGNLADALMVEEKKRPQLFEQLDLAVADRNPLRLQAQEVFVKGTLQPPVFWDLHFQLVTGEDGGKKMIVSVADVTKSVEYQQQLSEISSLQKTNSLWELSVSAGKIGTWHWDIETARLTWSKEQLALYGLKPEEFGGTIQEFHQRVLPEDLERMIRSSELNDKSADDLAYDFRIVRTDGEIRWIHARSRNTFNDKGELAQITGINIDVTAEKLAIARLEQSEEEFRQFSNNINNLAWITDGEGWIYWYNQRWFDYTGTTLEEMQGWGWEKVHHPDHRQRIVDFSLEAWKKPEPFELIFPLRRYDGTYRWFLTRAVPITNNEGKILKWIGTNTDIHEQVLAEEALEAAQAESEKQRRLYEAVAENTPDLVYILDPKTYRFTYANKALLRMLGKTWEQAVGKGLRENGYEDWHAQRHEREIDQVVATRQPVRGTVSFTHAELGARVYDYLFAPVINEQGEVEAIAGTTRDISDIRAAEIELKESEQRFRTIANEAPAFIFLGASDTNVEFVSRSWLEFTGLPSNQALGEAWATVTHPDDLEHAYKIYNDSYQAHTPYKMEIRQRSAAGEYRWIHWRGVPRFLSDGSFLGFVGLGTDITDLKVATDKIIESESLFRTLAESLPQMIWVSDAKGEIEFFNQRWAWYTGITDAVQAWTEMIHPEDKAASSEAFNNAVAQGASFSHELRLRSKDGQYRWHVSVAEPLKDNQGAIVRWVGALSDIHFQKTLSEKLEQMVEQRTLELKRSNDQLIQFAHMTSHDLKEPVRKMQIFGDQLSKEIAAAGSPRAVSILDRIMRSARRMQDLIDGVLQYSSVDAQHDLFEQVDLNAVLDSILTDLDLLIAEKDATMKINELPVVHGHAIILRQVFFNLLYNALKFARTDRTPLIQVVATDSDGSESQGRVSDGSYFKISVIDNGIGFAPEHAERIFDAFSRLNGKDAYEGSGLGLAFCRKVIDRVGGAIWGEGEEGKGASFHVLLPKGE